MRRRHLAQVLALVTGLLALLFAAPAALAGGPGMGNRTHKAFMTESLTRAAHANPNALFRVIVKGRKGVPSASVASAEQTQISGTPARGALVRTQFAVINATASLLSGKQILGLVEHPQIETIAEDVPMHATEVPSNYQPWPEASQVSSFWDASPAAPTIAVVDSGVDATRGADFDRRVLVQQTFLAGGTPNQAEGDGYGHGTFVASIAAGAGAGFTGAAPGANIVSLDVLDDTGAGLTSDVIAAADWIYQNKDVYGIRVANFSLCAGSNSSFLYDPLDQAVEKLWLNGVVVVAAAGNYAANGLPSGVVYAPANDPFVITVGAADDQGTVTTWDDFSAPWSAFGYTLDGFLKPELGAPGRYLNGAVPTTGAMWTQHPERIVADGYMWMSGTSFAAPVVAGAAAQLIAAHPDWTPDQVKGALMLTAAPAGWLTSEGALGVGEVQAFNASFVVDPPNPNAGLNQYVVWDSQGNLVFDAASWSSAAESNASWNSASWSSASWSSASWSSASWSSASWSSASWSSASWSSGHTTEGTLPSASWASLSWVS